MAIDNPVETLVGAGVVAIACGFAVYASDGLAAFDAEQSYTVSALFRNVNGVTVGSDVRIAGVDVGTVTGLDLDPNTAFARLSLTLEEGVELSEEASASIDAEGILGGAYVSIRPGAGFDVLGEGDEITITQGAVSLLDLIAQFASGGGDGAPAAPAPAAPVGARQ